MTERKFPTILKLWKYEIERIGRKRGLSFPSIIYEMVNDDEMWEMVTYAGFPVRYHHWTWGQEFLDCKNSGRMGSTVYELIANTDPCYGFLLNLNSLDTQKLVIAHAGCGHGDFFKNNVHCRKISKDMHNVFADHAAIIEQFRTEFGKERVDQFLEACMSLDTMIDFLDSFIDRFPIPRQENQERAKKQLQKIQSSEDLPYYMDEILNPIEFLEAQRKRIEEEEKKEIDVDRGVKIPALPVRDILGFILLHAPLEKWQRAIVYIIREETLFLYGPAQTKIMNEGWASFWHEEILIKEGVVDDAELFPFAQKHAGVLGAGINPYQLGHAMWNDIYLRWNTNRYGSIYNDCVITSIRNRWDEFAMCKYFIDRYGLNTIAFHNAWHEFSLFLQEMQAGRGTYLEEYFLSDYIVTEWLRYERACQTVDKLNVQLEHVQKFECDVDALLQDLVTKETNSEMITPHLLRFKARHDCWQANGSPHELLWTSIELKRELSRMYTLISLHDRINKREINLEKELKIPQEWFVWAKKNPDPIILGQGPQKIFEVRRTHNDISFIDEFFTQELCDQKQYFVFGIKYDEYVPDYGMTDVWTIRSRNYQRVKSFIIGQYLNLGRPQVEILDANFNNNRELYIKHLHDDRDLERKDLLDVLRRLWIIWGKQKTVHLETLETEWPKKRPWWEQWRPPGSPPLPLQEIKRKKIRFSCTNGSEISTLYI